MLLAVLILMFLLIVFYESSDMEESLVPPFSESTPEGRRVTKLDQILLNGNNITMVSRILIHLLCVP